MWKKRLDGKAGMATRSMPRSRAISNDESDISETVEIREPELTPEDLARVA